MSLVWLDDWRQEETFIKQIYLFHTPQFDQPINGLTNLIDVHSCTFISQLCVMCNFSSDPVLRLHTHAIAEDKNKTKLMVPHKNKTWEKENNIILSFVSFMNFKSSLLFIPLKKLLGTEWDYLKSNVTQQKVLK